MKNDNENKYLETSDFYFSAYLVADGNKIIDIDRNNPNRIIFIFELKDTQSKYKLIEDFLLGKTVVEPKLYAKSIKDIKQLIYTK